MVNITREANEIYVVQDRLMNQISQRGQNILMNLVQKGHVFSD